MSSMKNSAAGNAGNKNRATKPSFRNTRLGVLPTTIDSLSQLTVDAATKVALTAASVKLTVEIDAAGTRVFLADQRTGQMIGGPEDLSKLGGIRAFVTRERKEASGIEIARVITEIAYRASTINLSESQEFAQQVLDSSYGASIRPLLITLERLEANKVKLGDNTNPKNRALFEDFLNQAFVRIRNAYFRHIILITKGENKKGQLGDLLFNIGVPEYVHTKLTSQGFILDRSQELCRVLFPQDPSKGLVLTIKEWSSDTFLAKLGGYMLRCSGALMRLIRDEPLVRSITKIDASVTLTDESNPLIAKMLKARVHVVPPMKDRVYVTDPGSKMRGGWKFPSPNMDTPAGAMTALGVALLRVYSANLQSVDLVGDYYHTIVPGSVRKEQVSPTNNFYVQWANASQNDNGWIAGYTADSMSVDLRVATWRWIRTELRLSEKGEAGKSLAVALGLDTEAKPVLIKGTVNRAVSPVDGVAQPPRVEAVDYLPRIRPTITGEVVIVPQGTNLLAPITAVEAPLVDQFGKDYFPKQKRGKNKIAQGANLTRLGKEAKFLIEQVEKLSTALASRITVWLRGFSDERLQAAASKLALAQFDELFITGDIDSDDEDSSEDESNGGVDA